jgi:hypothetical protein
MAYYIVKYEHNEAGKRFVVRQLLSIIRGNFLGSDLSEHSSLFDARSHLPAGLARCPKSPIDGPEVLEVWV